MHQGSKYVQIIHFKTFRHGEHIYYCMKLTMFPLNYTSYKKQNYLETIRDHKLRESMPEAYSCLIEVMVFSDPSTYIHNKHTKYFRVILFY